MVGGANGQSSAASPPDAHGRVSGSQGGLAAVGPEGHARVGYGTGLCGVPRRRGYLCGRRPRQCWAKGSFCQTHASTWVWVTIATVLHVPNGRPTRPQVSTAEETTGCRIIPRISTLITPGTGGRIGRLWRRSPCWTRTSALQRHLVPAGEVR